MSVTPTIAESRFITSSPDTERRFLIHGVDWQSYDALCIALEENHVRMTYDRGSLELMSPSPPHEKYNERLGRFIETLAEELELMIEPGGSTTFRREDLERGLEPDKCFWIQNELAVRGKLELDLSHDPPPDLVVEIEITRSALDRMDIYAAMGVPEVWCFDGSSLVIHRLGKDRIYRPTEESPTFPGVPISGVAQFLSLSESEDYLSVIRSFRQWIRKQLAKE